MIRGLRSQGWRARARDAGRRRDWAEAARLYAELERVGRPRARDRVQHAHSLKEAGDESAAAAAYARAAELHPLDLDAQRQLGLYLRRRGAQQEAVDVLCRAAVLAPDDRDVQHQLDELGVSGPARAARLPTALLRGPRLARPAAWPLAWLRARVALATGRRLRRAGRRPEACARLEAVAADAPWSLALVTAAVGELELLDAPDAAATACRRALLREPRAPALYLALAGALLAGGHRPAARQAAMAAWRLQPGAPGARDALAGLGWTGADLETLATASWAAVSPAELRARPLVPPEDLDPQPRVAWGYLALARR